MEVAKRSPARPCKGRRWLPNHATPADAASVPTIYHLDTSRSERIVWLMEELGLPYALERFDRMPNILAPEELQRVHKLGRAPVIRDDDTVLAQSGATVEYIVARHGGGRLGVAPSDPAFAQYLYWLHYAEGSLLLQLLREWTLERFLPDADAAPGLARVRAATRQHLGFVDGHLAGSAYFAGPEFTAADVMRVFPSTTLLRFRKVDLELYPALREYLGRIEERPAYRRAMEVAGPGMKK